MSSVCRICLSGNTRLDPLKNDLLIDIYDKLSNDKFNSEDARPRALCIFCYQKLLRCHNFSQMAQVSEKIFTQLCSMGIEVTQEIISDFDLEMKEQLSEVVLPFISISPKLNAFSMETIEEETLPSIVIKEEVKTESIYAVLEEIDSVNENLAKSQTTLEINHTDENNGVKEQPLKMKVEQIKPENVVKVIRSKSQVKQFKPENVQKVLRSKNQVKQITPDNVVKLLRSKSQADQIKPEFSKNPVLKAFDCSECDKKFKWRSDLILHFRNHTGEKPFACNVCDKRFSKKCVWVRHERIHTGDRPFTCKVCNKGFNQKYDLVVHTRIHTGEKPYACNVCGKKFKHGSYLVVHLRTTHSGEKPFTCNECGKSFNRRSNLITHIRNHTTKLKKSTKTLTKKLANKMACAVCNKAFKQKAKLVAHENAHKNWIKHNLT